MIVAPRQTILANGLRVIAVEMPHLHSAEVALYIRAGGRNDLPEKAGLAHFLEHMLFRGTAEHPTNLELEAAFEAIGGAVNAATDAESTCYYSRIHPDHLPEAVRLLSVMLLSPTFAGIDIEKRIITEEALEDINERGEEINPDNLASRLLWPDHPLGMPTIGFLETIAGFTESDLRDYLGRHYVPGNAVLVAAGRLAAGELFAAAATAFATWQGPLPLPGSPAPAGQTAPQALFVKDADSQINLQIAFRGFARDDRRNPAARLLRRLLSGGGCSRLHLSLRERLGIVYSVDAQLASYDETGCFSVDLATAPENLIVAVREVLREVRLLTQEPVDAEELERVKQGYFFDLAYSRDSTFDMQVRYGWGELMGMVKSIEEDRAEAAAVTPALIREVAGQLFAPAGLNLVAVGPLTARLKKEVTGMLDSYAADCR
ncbi:peptidase M16 [Geotalea uraniireducens]|uniref:Peptidase M16 n=1 Tax=Geotalea uraniireducens TaxID=351604 RepID=A0ABN6VWM2_9BACT|nr:pitrilysin family protein [Geotalea uraniireducens]BDV44823.1 peptidase M16 [Geotalea uraniireducens]